MPIKVRCKECSTVMGAPDKAAGRAIKCKGCGARVAVPSGGSGERRPKKKKKRRPAPEPSFDMASDGDDLFGGLDLRRAEDRRQKVCPSCAGKVDDEDIECPHCGVNIDTGKLSEKKKMLKARKGPPPDEFYGQVWPNGWKFLMDHKGYAVKSGLNWGFSLAMMIVSAFILDWYIAGRVQELVDSAEGPVTIDASGVLIQPTAEVDAKYDGVKYGPGSTRLINGQLRLPAPRVAALTSPPTLFWGFIFLVFTLGSIGWAWTLAGKVMEVTLSRQKKITRFHGDMFANMSNGALMGVWPAVLMYPVIWIPNVMFAVGGVSQTAAAITFIVIFLIPIFVFLPIAVVHNSQTYTYRAWLINWMMKDWVNTLVPATFVSALFVGLVLLVPLGIAIGVAVGWDNVANFYTNSVEVPALNAMFGYTAEGASSTWNMVTQRAPLLLAVSFTACTLICMLIAFPAVFMMRVFGLFGLYFGPDLSLCVEQVPLSPAGFGPRFLAYLVDSIVTSLIFIGVGVASGFVLGLFRYMNYPEQMMNVLNILLPVGGNLAGLALYYTQFEAGSGRATPGKWSLGMIVLQDDNEPMSTKLAFKRAAVALVSPLTFYATFIMCAFHPEHKALHDIATKTKVVWRGDEET